jgi:hypothetical protein
VKLPSISARPYSSDGAKLSPITKVGAKELFRVKSRAVTIAEAEGVEPAVPIARSPLYESKGALPDAAS